MDLNDIRIAVTMVSLGLFLALIVHTWSARRRHEHEAAAALPFIDDDTAAPACAAAAQGERRE
jgi:cbb3-type cytochrome oxidase subunit 3